MKFVISPKTRNFVFYALLCIGIICVIIAAQAGQQQDVVFNSDYNMYQQANNLVAQGNFADAGQTFATLLDSHPDSYVLMWQYAYCLGQQGQYAKAAPYYEKARQQKPFIVDNQQYVLMAGENYYYLGQYTEAYKYLLRASNMHTDPNLSNSAASFLKKMDKVSKK